jgi:signal transduction histidine kinase
MIPSSRHSAVDPVHPPIDDSDVVQVLVVDDQASNLEAIEALLTQSGCRLIRAQSADEALLALLDQEFAAIILDIRMPGMGGFELAELIKQRRRTRDVPILFLTAHTMDEREVLRGYGTGAVDYLTKPVHSDILRSKVAVFIELFRKRRALAQANARLQREVGERERVQDALRLANRDLERRVQERTDALQRADRRKDEFLASLAHELRNPLAPIRSAVEILEGGIVPEADAARARAVVVRQVDHMTRLIDDLLDVSRITCDKLSLQVSRVDLAQVVATAVETSRPLMDELRHTLTVHLPPTPVVLEADGARLAQVLSNLLTNAAKYTAAGGEVRLSAEVQDAEVVIRVTDNGIGIEADMLARVFELFIQGDHPRDRSGGGLGIGLTLARRLVEMHGGRLEARSEGPGRGSEFSVRLSLPLWPAHEDAPEGEQKFEHTSRRRVLVVDDNHDAAEMLAVMLGTWGQETRVAHDGIQALATAEAFQPEIVLLDIGLPDLDGYEVARRLRTEPWGRRALLVAVTGWGQESDLERSRHAGFDRHLVKPVVPGLLRELIAGALPGSREEPSETSR